MQPFTLAYWKEGFVLASVYLCEIDMMYAMQSYTSAEGRILFAVRVYGTRFHSSLLIGCALITTFGKLMCGRSVH